MPEQMTAQQMEAVGLIPADASPGLKKELEGAIAPFAGVLQKGAFQMTQLDKHVPGVYKLEATPMQKAYQMAVMKAVLKDRFGADNLKDSETFKKSFISTGDNISGYDLAAPAKTLVPWLYPIREALPRVRRPNPGTIAHWKVFTTASTSFSKGTLPAMPWVNEGARAPQIALKALNASASYATIGREGAVSFEAQSASQGFDDALALEHFFTMETVFSMEEDSLLGGNNSLKLATANKPVGSATGTGAFTGTFYAAVVGLTYEGYRNFTMRNGFDSDGTPLVASGLAAQQQVAVTTPDGKTMTTNGGCGIASAISTTAAGPSSNTTATFTWTPKSGEFAWLIYIGTSSSAAALHLVALKTVPNYSFTSDPAATGEALSALTATDFSVNDGTTGGGTNQVTAFDGLLYQALSNNDLDPQNAYVLDMNGGLLTTSGKGNVDQIDAMLMQMWNLYKMTVDVILVNAQEMASITSRVLNGSSAPLLRVMGDSDGFDVTGYGVISFYHNPYIPGGRKIPIIIHPTIPPGTILAMAKSLPPYYKSNSVPNVAEVLTRRDYYAQEWPLTTREYQYGVYSEEVLACYAPFAFGLIKSVGNG